MCVQMPKPALLRPGGVDAQANPRIQTNESAPPRERKIAPRRASFRSHSVKTIIDPGNLMGSDPARRTENDVTLSVTRQLASSTLHGSQPLKVHVFWERIDDDFDLDCFDGMQRPDRAHSYRHRVPSLTAGLEQYSFAALNWPLETAFADLRRPPAF